MNMKLPCSCCQTPVAELQNGILIIESRHHGVKHTSVFVLRELDKEARIPEHVINN